MRIYKQNNAIRLEDGDIVQLVNACDLDVQVEESGILFLVKGVKLFRGQRYFYEEVQDELNSLVLSSYEEALEYINSIVQCGCCGVDLSQIEADIDNLNSDVLSLQSDVNTLDSTVSGLEGDLIALDGRVTTNENDIATLGMELQSSQLRWFNRNGMTVTQNKAIFYHATALAIADLITIWVTDDGTQSGNLVTNALTDAQLQVTCTRQVADPYSEAPFAYVEQITTDGKGVVIRVMRAESGRIRGFQRTYRGLELNSLAVVVYLDVVSPTP